MKRTTKRTTTRRASRLPNPAPVDPIVGRTFYLFDKRDGVVSVVCSQVNGDRVLVHADAATYSVDRRSLFETYAACRDTNGALSDANDGRDVFTVYKPTGRQDTPTAFRVGDYAYVFNGDKVDMVVIAADTQHRGSKSRTYAVVPASRPAVEPLEVDAACLFAGPVSCLRAFPKRPTFESASVFPLVPIATPRGRGRPRSADNRPQRTLGRVNEADWQTLQEAARIAGKTFTAFALSTLLAAARRLIATHERT